MVIPSAIKRFADEDINIAITAASKASNKNFSIKSISLDRTSGNDSYGIVATAVIASSTNREHNVKLRYRVKGDDVFAHSNLNGLAKRIIAAEDDETFIDTIDDISDSVDDMQEQLDDIEEDEPNIEMDNNIANHYIAECDRCQGVFISALAESDQEVEKISGTCPLCEKESTQYLKWIVKDV